MKASHGASVVLAIAAAGCANLSLLEEDVCGNRVVEAPDEACDGQEGCGAPGSAHQCRYLCGGAEGFVCPGGYGCGADGVCRRPTGVFEELSARTMVTAMELSAGDINADGCDELVHTTLESTTITALPSQAPGLCAQAEQALPIARAASSEETSPAPILRDLTSDGQLELIVAGRGDVVAAQGGAANGLFVFSASESAAMAPTLYATTRLDSEAARLLSARLRGRDAALIFLGAAAATGGANGGGTGGEPPASAGPGRVAVMSDPAATPQTLDGDVVAPGDIAAAVAADLDGDAAADAEPCDEAIVAKRGDDRIRIYAVCGPAGSNALAALPEVQLGGGARIRDVNASLAVHDQNGDGFLDIVVNAIHGDLGEIHVAYGLGNGRFHSTPSLPSSGSPDQRTGALSLGDAELEAALADPDRIFVAGDFDADRPGPELVPLDCRPGAPFQSPVCGSIGGGCEAIAADVNADGHLDIVATETQLPDITVYTGASDGTFYTQRVATQCPPHYLAVGDFDGDRVNDIAYFDQQARPSSPQPSTRLDIAYGNAFAAPSAPAGHGRLDLASGLVAGRVLQEATGVQLFALRGLPRPPDAPVGSGSGLALIEGGRDRLIRAPFYFAAPPGAPGGMPPGPGMPPGSGASSSILPVRLLAVAGGMFATGADGEPQQRLAAITELAVEGGPGPVPEGTQLWLISVSPEGDNLRAEASGRPGEGAPPCDACVLAPIDTDGDRRDELVWLNDGELAIYAADGEKLVEAARQETAHVFKAIVEDVNPPKYAPRPLVADLDGDGQQDLLARADSGEIVALWGRAGGGFDETALVAPEPCEGDKVCAGLAVALLNADADVALEVAVAGPGRLELYDLDAGARALRRLETTFPGPPPEAGSDFVALVAGDVDGDGVDDLAVAMSSAFLKVFRGKPVLQ
ncbi:FG-GAP repeat domain-containing protein [Sorangium atrum]|uniref:VCBS repeat-containing protein n=1 Tax=Sorangium atrum TaxID=2995308 RepID=A0ABT5C702_9BACT|nr:VCBS repeat-containing protein [Sorangium aterium]MDC0681443.1 VCBS repeat-containing protein [Sorangium aterium]